MVGFGKAQPIDVAIQAYPITISVLVANNSVEISRDRNVPQHCVCSVVDEWCDNAAGAVCGLRGLDAVDGCVDEEILQVALLRKAHVDAADRWVIGRPHFQILDGNEDEREAAVPTPRNVDQ